jgi:hypothetical protein
VSEFSNVHLKFCKIARWYIFIPKISIHVYFLRPWSGKC